MLSIEELGRLLEMAPGPKYRAPLGTAYGAGMRVSEVTALKVGDIVLGRFPYAGPMPRRVLRWPASENLHHVSRSPSPTTIPTADVR